MGVDQVLTTLGSVVARTRGMLQTGPFGSQLHASDYQPTGTPLVMPINLGDNEIYESGISRVGVSDARRLSRHALREGDIIFSRRGDVGRRSLVREKESGWLCGTGCLAARFGPDRTAVNPAYIAEFLGSHAAQAWLFNNAVGGTMPNLNTSILAALPIVLPPKHEQDQIVSASGDVRQTIATLERLSTKKRAIKQGMMQHLLGLSAARNWAPIRMQELVQAMFSGPSPTCEERTIRGPEWGVLKTTCATWQSGWNPAMHKVLPIEFWGRKSIEVHVGDSIVTKAGPRHRVGVPAYVSAIQPQIVPSGKMICVRPNQARVLPGFLSLALADRRTQEFLDQRSTGMAESQVNFENADLRAAPIWLPSLEDQRHILEALTDVDSQIATLDARLTKTRDIKTGTMQQLLTGRTRLPVMAAS